MLPVGRSCHNLVEAWKCRFIAGMFLTTECVIVEKKEDKPEMPMGAPAWWHGRYDAIFAP